ncbi:MAG: PaaX family transcriptional regulator [Actinomycetota bacterium]
MRSATDPGVEDATPVVPAVFDDIDARPGSTASLLRTVIGLYVRRLGGRISSADLVRLAGDLGMSPERARTGIARLKQKGLLVASRDEGIGYRLNSAALPMLERGDRRIFSIRRMQDADRWCLISFTIPESRRDVRHRLRRRLQWIGCGTVASGLWICPAYLQDEVEQILRELGVRSAAVLFRTDAPSVEGSLTDAVATWWDLDALRGEHEEFQMALTTIESDPVDPHGAFVAYVRLIDAWRVLPYVDPGLPPALLPPSWPGPASFDAYATRSAALEGAAWDHVRSLAAP